MSSAPGNGTPEKSANGAANVLGSAGYTSLEVEAQTPWIDLSKSVEPKPTLERAADIARFLVTTSSIVTGILAAFGGPGVSQESRYLTALALLIGLSATILPLYYLAPRLAHINPDNLADVEEWYKQHVSRRWTLPAAGLLLPTSLVLASYAAVASASAVYPPVVGATIWADGSGARLANVTIECSKCDPGETKQVRILSRSGNNLRRSLATGTLTPDQSGVGSLSYVEIKLRITEELIVEVSGLPTTSIKGP